MRSVNLISRAVLVATISFGLSSCLPAAPVAPPSDATTPRTERGTPRSRVVETGRNCTVGLFGDSLSYGIAVYGAPADRLRERGCTLTHIDTVWGRTTSEGAASIERLAQQRKLPEILVVVLGSNDCDYDVMAEGVDRILRAAGPDRPIVWQNVYRVGCDEPVNRALADRLAVEAARPRSGRLWLVDQHAVVARAPRVLIDDVHLTEQGSIDSMVALANTISSVIIK